MTKKDELHVQPTVSMPSADLITYRFDQTDKKLDDLKLQVNLMTATFATKEEMIVLEKRLDNYTWYWRAVFTALLLCISGLIVALIGKR